MPPVITPLFAADPMAATGKVTTGLPMVVDDEPCDPINKPQNTKLDYVFFSNSGNHKINKKSRSKSEL